MAISAFADDIRDIKPPVYFQTNYLLLLILAGILILLILVFLGIIIFKKIKKRENRLFLTPKSAHQITYEALERLRMKNLPASGMIKEYYFELSDIARRYIENRFSIRAPEMTTEEFLFSLRESGVLSGTHKNLLKEFLNLCDIVKFAKYGPTQKEIDDSFNAAKKLVDETKVIEEKLEKAPVK